MLSKYLLEVETIAATTLYNPVRRVLVDTSDAAILGVNDAGVDESEDDEDEDSQEEDIGGNNDESMGGSLDESTEEGIQGYQW